MSREPNAKLEELESLLLEWELGTLDEDGVRRVRAMLRDDQQAQTHFAKLQSLSAALQAEQSLGSGLPPVMSTADELEAANASLPGTPRSPGTPRRTASHHALRISYWFAATAAALMAVMAGRLAYLEFAVPSPSGATLVASDTPEPTSSGVALVTRLVDVSWGSDAPAVSVGEALMPGTLAIESGFAQIEFFCGATVILEGPAELDLKSSTLARVRRGRLRAQVPPAARGFEIEVDDMRVVDLGTEFGLAVTDEGADLQVFDGEVELHQPQSAKRLLVAGEAVATDAGGTLTDAVVTPERFTDTEALHRHATRQQNDHYESWKESSRLRRKDPRVIAYYPFDEGDVKRRRLLSRADMVDQGLASRKLPARELDGAIVGARTVSGRWGSKPGLEFKQPGDRVRVHIPGEYGSLTFACWVKIDSLDRWYNSLFLTDGYDMGEPHWQVLDTGQLFFSVRVKRNDGSGPEHREVLSPPFWEPALSGKWLHLVTTYSVEDQVVTHYLDGEVLHRESIPDYQLVPTTRFGMATIGNWSSPQRPNADFAIRNLNGSLDEFTIFATALPASEIKEMYQHGKP